MLFTKYFQSSSPPDLVGKCGHVTVLAIGMPLLGRSFKSQDKIHHALCPSVQVTRNVPINPHGSQTEDNIKQICKRCGMNNK